MNKDLDYTTKFEGISEEKMSVSEALDFVNEALLEKGYDPIVYRFMCLQSHYRRQLLFSYESLDNTKQAYDKLKNRIIMELLFIGGLGTSEILLIVLALLLLFGGKKLPELMRGAGRGIREFKDAVNTASKDIDDEKKPAAKEEKTE